MRENHHSSSHHANERAKIDAYKTITRWHVGQFAYLLGKLRNVREGERTLLDNSLVLCGSSLSDGNRHDPNNLPILLGGRGGGRVRSGRHVASPRNTPLCNLYKSMLGCLGVPAARFGDRTGPLRDLTA